MPGGLLSTLVVLLGHYGFSEEAQSITGQVGFIEIERCDLGLTELYFDAVALHGFKFRSNH